MIFLKYFPFQCELIFHTYENIVYFFGPLLCFEFESKLSLIFGQTRLIAFAREGVAEVTYKYFT